MNLSQENIEKIIVGVATAIVILILSEPIKAAFRKIGAWFEGFFQSLGFGFQKRYFRALIHAHQWLKLIGVYIPSDLHAPRLQEVYISLRMNTAKDAPPVSWNRVFNGADKHIVILGQPGSGKSTLLDYLILVFTGHIKHPLRADLKNPLPVFVRLRDLGAQSLLTLAESPENTGLKKVPAGYFERNLMNGKCIVFLDGLDEVLDEAIHKQVVREIASFANTYPDNWIVVTCREQGWHGQLPNFSHYRVQEFDRDDVNQFIGAWYSEVTRSEEIKKLGAAPKLESIHDAEEKSRKLAKKSAENLWNALRKNESLLRIARTPLILSLVTLVHKNRTADLPQGRARLYRECLDILLDIWDSKDKELVAPDAPSPNDKLLALKTIAFHYMEQGLLEMDIDGLEKLVEPLLPTLKKAVSAKSLIRQIHQRSGVLVEQAIGKYGFAHRALHDYLAAKYIEEHNLDSILLDHAAEEHWREVILIAIGLVQPQQRAETLLASLLRQSDDSPAGLAVAGRSLAEDIQVSDGLRTAVRVKIVANLEHPQSNADFALLSGALFDTDPLAMQNWIGSVLAGHNPDLQKRVLASLIPDLGLEQVKPSLSVLTKLLADSHTDVNLRVQCTLAIAKLRPSVDRELWNALDFARRQDDEKLRVAAMWATCELGRFEEFGLVKVPAGEFLMGDSNKRHAVFLPGYYIAKYPVTVDEYRTFVRESRYKTQDEGSLNGIAKHPVVYVTWNDSLAFAKWNGMTLPSEAEWEKAARGTDEQMYPWGSEWRGGMANTSEYWERHQSFWDRLRRQQTRQTTTPVGSFSPHGDSPFGCADMVGNVWEWTRSIFREYPYNVNDGRENESTSERRVVRGGSYYGYEWNVHCAFRNWQTPYYADNNLGFRLLVSSPRGVS